jgi:uncharacterized membrane protein
MIAFENRITIRRPSEEIFAFIADFRNIPKWNYFVKRVEKTSKGPATLGSVFYQIRKSDEQFFQITQIEPNKKIVIETIKDEPLYFEIRFLFKTIENGTIVTDQWNLNTKIPNFIEKLTRSKVKNAVRSNLEKLKELMENGKVRLQDGRLVILENF